LRRGLLRLPVSAAVRERRLGVAVRVYPILNEREETVMATAPNHQALGVVVEWLDAMRRGDRDALVECFWPDVTWRGIVPDAVCRDRAEVLDMLEHRLAVGTPRAEALELIHGNTGVALGVRSDDLQEIADVPVPGQLFNVFEVRDGRIASIRDFIRRRDALHAAGANEPRWT